MLTFINSIYQHGPKILRIRNIITSTIQCPCLSLTKNKKDNDSSASDNLLNSAKTEILSDQIDLSLFGNVLQTLIFIDYE